MTDGPEYGHERAGSPHVRFSQPPLPQLSIGAEHLRIASLPSRATDRAPLTRGRLKSGAEEVVDAEGVLGLVAPSPPSSDFLPYNYLASGQLSATKSLLLPSTGRYLVLGTSAPPVPGKRRAEFKMKSSSEVT